MASGEFEVGFGDYHEIPERVLGHLRNAQIKVEPEDLLPILSGVVHDAGEYLHRSGGTDGRFDCEHDDNPARIRAEAARALAAVEALIELNAIVGADDARRSARQARGEED